MFTLEEKNKLYRVIKTYDKISKVSCFTEDVPLEEESVFNWDYCDFLDFILDEKYISKGQYNQIKRMYEASNFDYPEDFLTVFLGLSEKFEIWYINYISNLDVNFDKVYYDITNFFRKQLNSSYENAVFFDKIEDFEKWMDKNMESNLYEDDSNIFFKEYIIPENDITFLTECLEALMEVSLSEIETEIINKMKEVISCVE